MYKNKYHKYVVAIMLGMVPVLTVRAEPPKVKAVAKREVQKNKSQKNKAVAKPVEAWKDDMEVRFDCYSYRDNGFSDEYIKHLKDKIEATATVKLANTSSITEKDREKIDEALWKLGMCKDTLGYVKAGIDGMSSDRDRLKAMVKIKDIGIDIAKGLKNRISGLIKLIENKVGNFAKIIYGKQDKDFKKLVVYIAFLRDEMKFRPVINELAILYFKTKNNDFKSEINKEFKKIKNKSKEGRFGPYDNKFKKFYPELRKILSE
jgi:hypothetical protein